MPAFLAFGSSSPPRKPTVTEPCGHRSEDRSNSAVSDRMLLCPHESFLPKVLDSDADPVDECKFFFVFVFVFIVSQGNIYQFSSGSHFGLAG